MQLAPERAVARVPTCHPWMTLFPTLCRWVFVYEKGYQTSSGLISSVSVKLKGLTVTHLPEVGPQVWDVADYVFPAQVSFPAQLRDTPSTHKSWLRAGLGSVPPPCGTSQLQPVSGLRFP